MRSHPLRILLFPSSYYPAIGGVEEHVRQVAHIYKQRGHRVLILAPLQPISLPTFTVIEDQEVWRIPTPLPSPNITALLNFMFNGLTSIAKALHIAWHWKPDLVHVHCSGPNSLYAMFIVQSLHIPLIFTSHGEQTFPATRVYRRSRVRRWMLYNILRRADFVTACSAFAASGLLPYRALIQKPPVIVPNGVNLEELAPTTTPTPHPRPYLFSLGRHVWQKGFNVLIDAFNELAQHYANLDLIIGGNGPMHHSLVVQAHRLGVNDRVYFPGFLDRSTINSYYKHCQLFLLPSLRETFGIVIVEAMAARKAVVATEVGGVVEIIKHGQNGFLVPSNDVKALVGAISQLLDDPKLVTNLGMAALEHVKENYTWDKVADQYIKLYQNALHHV